jgi:hypothetical protein
MPKIKYVTKFHVSRGLLGELIIFLKRTSNIPMRVILGRVPVTIVAVKKQ